MSGFDSALRALKAGKKVARLVWREKGGFWLKMRFPGNNGEMTLPYIYIKFPENEQYQAACVPWNAAQIDMLADDWVVVDD